MIGTLDSRIPLRRRNVCGLGDLRGVQMTGIAANIDEIRLKIPKRLVLVLADPVEDGGRGVER